MFQSRTLRELLLAAGLWLTASATLAAPQPGLTMKLGASALPPKGYVAFCHRQPGDCGADRARVLAEADHVDAERLALAKLWTPADAQTASTGAPGAVDVPATDGLIKVKLASAELAGAATTEFAPASQPLEALIARAAFTTDAEFIDPMATARPATEAGPPTMTPDLWAKLNRINDKVNRAIVRQTDRITYDQDDYWATPLEDGVKYGDCEDYVLEKRRALQRAGLPASALNIALVTTSWGESHAVLLVATRDGEYVLDNLTRWVTPWEAAPYRWNERQINGEAFNWVMVAPPVPSKSQGLLIASLR